MEDGAVDPLGHCVLHQDQAAARAAQRLVGGRRHHVGEGHRVGIDAGSDQAGIVRHVDHEIGAHRLCHFCEALEIDAQRIGRRASDDQLGAMFMGQPLHRVVVDGLVGVQAIAHHLEPLAAHVQGHAVGQVPAFGQAQAHDGVAGLQQAEEDGLVGLRARIGLHIGMGRTKQLLGTVDGQLFDDVHVLAAAVVALARITLGVLIGQLRALGLHYGGRGVVLTRNQLDVGLLARVFEFNGGPEHRINGGER